MYTVVARPERPYTTRMFQSHRYSHLVLRGGLAISFLWMGIQKFIVPHTWGGAGLPLWVEHGATIVGMSADNVFVLLGIVEVLIATSLAAGFFERWFAVIGVVLLLAALLAGGHPEAAAHEIGILGGLLALTVWPQRRYTS